jgi:AbrB family looped-hinge helix DNA binding protein
MEATVAERGQITLPKAVRDALGLTKGTRLKVELEGGRIVCARTCRCAVKLRGRFCPKVANTDEATCNARRAPGDRTYRPTTKIAVDRPCCLTPDRGAKFAAASAVRRFPRWLGGVCAVALDELAPQSGWTCSREWHPYCRPPTAVRAGLQRRFRERRRANAWLRTS